MLDLFFYAIREGNGQSFFPPTLKYFLSMQNASTWILWNKSLMI